MQLGFGTRCFAIFVWISRLLLGKQHRELSELPVSFYFACFTLLEKTLKRTVETASYRKPHFFHKLISFLF